jgi:hypothetical protein
VSAMCRKCLSSAPEQARRCKSCGGPIVRFDESGGMVETEQAAEEAGVIGGIPPLFADLDDGWPQEPSLRPQSPPATTAQPPQAPVVPHIPGPVQPSGTLIMPASQLDDIVSGMLRPFGFEQPPEAQAAGSSPLQGSPINQSEGAPAPQVQPNQEPSVPLFSRSSPPTPARQAQAPEPSPREAAVPGPVAHQSAAETQKTAPANQVPSGEEHSGEDALSMAAMVRDIMAISDQDPGSPGKQPAGSTSTTDSARQASDDLVIRPASKIGFLKRSKTGSKGRADKPHGPDSEDPMSELAQEASQTRSRLRSR